MHELENNLWERIKEEDLLNELDFLFAKSLLLKTEAEIIFAAYLFSISRQGHVCLKVRNNEISPPVEIEDDEFKEKIKNYLIEGSKSISKDLISDLTNESFPNKPICFYKESYYLQRNWVFETKVVTNLERLLKNKRAIDFDEKKFLEEIKSLENGNILEEEQINALRNVFYNQISIICGGPGTGKTFTASHIIFLFKKLIKEQSKIIVSAPTGKAVSHIQSTIKGEDIQIITLHALLEMRENKNRLFDDKEIYADLLIVDEASMIDIKMMAYLLSVISENTRVVLIGDPMQLSPVETGNVFADLIRKEKFATATLNVNKRFEKNKIADLSKLLLENRKDDFFELLEKGNRLISIEENKSVKEIIEASCEKYFIKKSLEPILPESALQNLKTFCFLSCIKKTKYGVEKLNNEIFEFLFNDIEFNEYRAIPLIITKNNYRLDIYNGQIGIYIDQYKGKKGLYDGDIYIMNEGRVISYPISLITNYELAYALSVHKSQGSEFDNVILFAPESSELFGREIIYTALTRAKKEIKIVSTKNILEKAMGKILVKQSNINIRI